MHRMHCTAERPLPVREGPLLSRVGQPMRPSPSRSTMSRWSVRPSRLTSAAAVRVVSVCAVRVVSVAAPSVVASRGEPAVRSVAYAAAVGATMIAAAVNTAAVVLRVVILLQIGNWPEWRGRC